MGLLALLAVTELAVPELVSSPAQAAARKTWKKKKKPAAPPIPVPKRAVTIAKVDAGTIKEVRASAAKIDALIEANYKKYKIKPNAEATDEHFVRRAYLEIRGTIPTYRQVKSFLNSKDPEKRSRLIDLLLNSPGYASNFYNYWGDILRVNERLTNNAEGRPYQEWIKENLETNKPYDKWVYEMLAAEGKYLEHPETGYIVRDSGMPLDAMNNTVRIFLGTQIGCAQCHNHPFDRWTQKEFYQIAAYTYGTATRRGAADKMMFGGKNVVATMRTELVKNDPNSKYGYEYNRFLFNNLVEVYDTGRKLRLPHDYQYTDAKPLAPIDPKSIFGPPATVKKDETPREAFAHWLTSKNNPRFATTIANRLWKKCFGVGQIEPVDDMRDDSIAENPELMKFLASEMIRVKFDMKEYLRIIMNTKAYQREASIAEVTPGEDYHFAGPILRRMTAEQVWDSFITLAVFEPEDYQIEPARVVTKYLDVDLAKSTAEEIIRRDKELKEATSYKVRKEREKAYKYKGQLLVRASELPVPAPASHFLRQFGQSDREGIQTSSTGGSVPQVLQMFNGPITHMLLEKDSMMFKNVVAERNVNDGLDVIFMSILSRRPDANERKTAIAAIYEDQLIGFGNIIWALVNTREFLFIQ